MRDRTGGGRTTLTSLRAAILLPESRRPCARRDDAAGGLSAQRRGRSNGSRQAQAAGAAADGVAAPRARGDLVLPPPDARAARSDGRGAARRRRARLARAGAAGRVRAAHRHVTRRAQELTGLAPRRRAAYQEASALTTARHRTAKFVFAALTRHGLRPAKGQPPLPLLEARAPTAQAPALRSRAALAHRCAAHASQVGAVNTQLLSVPWLATRAIDLRSTHPRIEQLDFFALAPAAQFGAVVCAMARPARRALR